MFGLAILAFGVVGRLERIISASFLQLGCVGGGLGDTSHPRCVSSAVGLDMIDGKGVALVEKVSFLQLGCGGGGLGNVNKVKI